MYSSFEIVATVLLALVTMILIHMLIFFIIRFPPTRERSEIIWDSRVLGEWAEHQTLSLRSCIPVDSQKGQPIGSSKFNLASIMSTLQSFERPIYEYVRILELPVIFLASPDDMQGPVEGEIWYIDGSVESCKQTRTMPFESQNFDMGSGQGRLRERLSTVDNDKASWLQLLEVLQKMECDSMKWESRQLTILGKNGEFFENAGLRSLAVGVQPHKRTFGSTSTFKRPFATTTICHIVELAAVLGLYWKQFDKNQDKYRAEGNGLSLRGVRVESFGIVFTFERIGRFNFQEKRVIPTSHVKELCFGNAPTFYQPRNPSGDIDWQAGATTKKPTSLEMVRLGSQQDVADTLALIGCNRNTISHFLNPERQKTHLFPVEFEIMGMLCRTYHLKNRCFTYLPNPTIHHWKGGNMSLRRLLSAFRKDLSNLSDRSRGHVPPDIQYIQSLADELDLQLPDRDQRFNPLEQSQLHDTLSKIDNILGESNTPKMIVLDVIRQHIQETLLAMVEQLNEAQIRELQNVTPKSPSFAGVFLLPPELREHEFMSVYFWGIRPRVICLESEVTEAGSINLSDKAKNASLQIHLANNGDNCDGDDGLTKGEYSDHESRPKSSGPEKIDTHTPSDLKPLLDSFGARRNTIWCALVFRMIVWLLLHDFDEQDVQVPKGETQGSRLPVYIQ